MLEELPRTVGRYQFTHALIQETLAGELSITRRVRLHARIAESLEELYGSDADVHAAELAHHFAQAEAVVGTEKLVHYSLLAGDRALSSHAYEEALSHFEQGLLAKGVSPSDTKPTEDAQAAALFFGLGQAQAATLPRHQVHWAVNSLGHAFDHYADAGDVHQAVAVAECPLPDLIGQQTGMPQLIGRALALVPPDSLQAGRLLSRYGRVMGNEEGDYEAAQEALGRALSIAQREQDAFLEMWTLAHHSAVDCFHLHFQHCIENGLRAIELARQLDDPRTEIDTRVFVSISLMMTGRLDEAQQHATLMLSLAEGLRSSFWLGSAFVNNAFLSSLRGDWQVARDFSDRGLAVAPQDIRLLANRVLIEYEVGEFSQGEACLERFLELFRSMPPGPTVRHSEAATVIPFVSRITGVMNLLDVAEAAALDIISSSYATPLVGVMARVGLGLQAVLRGDVGAAREQYAPLKSHQGIMFPQSMPTDRLLGLLAHTMADPDLAAKHFEDAVALCRKAGYRPELAWTCCDYADMLRERDGDGDKEKAVALLDESLAISSELGMRPLMERVLSRREILGA